jgi:hypothetical protein
MNSIRTQCPACGVPLEVPQSFDSAICAACGTSYEVRRYKGTINLSPLEPGPMRSLPGSFDSEELAGYSLLDKRLEELDEAIEEVGTEIETIRSREQAAPLQFGCAMFSAFTAVLAVIAIFMPLGREYFGGWIFYLTLGIVIFLAVTRLRKRLASRAELVKYREDREHLQSILAELETERGHLMSLKLHLSSDNEYTSEDND